MADLKHIPLVEVTRGQIVESVHYGSLAIAHADGSALFTIGDPVSPVFLRSSAKPFQTLAFLERGGAEFYHLEDKEIALISASHSGTSEHLEVLRALQAKVGIREQDLQCGAHTPYHAASARQLVMARVEPRNNHNNCSGKHTGMLAFAKMIGAPLDTYLENSHPVQQAILQTFAQICNVDTAVIELGTDGCTAPVFGLPLPAAAAAYARLCQPEGLATARAQACLRITQAMSTHPFMVAGPQRFDTDAMAAGGGAFVSKVGAEGYLGLGILPGRARGFTGGLGITLKISDGDLTQRAFCVVALVVLSTLGVLDATQREALQAYDQRPVRNWRGKEIGKIRPTPDLLGTLKALHI